MVKYAKVIDKEKGLCQVGEGNPDAVYKTITDQKTGNKKTVYIRDYYISLGLSQTKVQKGEDGQWYLAGYKPSKAVSTQQELIKEYKKAVQQHLDTVAQSRGYDDTYTCLSYISSTDEIWRRESNAFNAWRDKVWRSCHNMLNAIMRGQINHITIEDMIESLPVIDWNDSVKVE